jgi:hypothetical protein
MKAPIFSLPLFYFSYEKIKKRKNKSLPLESENVELDIRCVLRWSEENR